MALYGRQKQKAQPARKGKGRRRRSRRGPDPSTLILVLMLLVGSAIMAYPSFADWWNNSQRYHEISHYVDVVNKMDKATIEEMFKKADEYNARLVKKTARFSTADADVKEYESILNVDGKGMIGFVQVPRLALNYPIYHGVSDEVLATSIGHIEGTTFPIGGDTRHAAISGHRGLPSARLFSEIDKLVAGDTFSITILDRTLTYAVDEVHIVLPQDFSFLNFEEGADLCTLVTCTPYGVNTHRLLVRGHRVEGLGELHAIPADGVQIPNYIAVPAVGIPILFIYLVGSLLYYHYFEPVVDKRVVMAELGQIKDGEAFGKKKT